VNSSGLEPLSREDRPSPDICLCCGATHWETCLPKAGGIYYHCRQCNLYVSSLRHVAEEAHDTHSAFDATAPRDLTQNLASDFSVKQQKVFDTELHTLEKYRKTNQLLDMGCGTGGFIHAAQERQWQVLGTEVSQAAAAAAAGKGLTVYLSSLAKLPCEPESLDVIRMHDVLEHLADPVDVLQSARHLLREGGLLQLTTVNMDCLSFRYLREEWKYVHPQFHIHLFDTHNLNHFLQKMGFAITHLHTEGVRTRTKGSTLFSRLLRIPARLFGKGHRMEVWAEKISP
jgi:2-polyprenyl-3-methyl-5-hydroxy-6-metoxy-1,4-benzoquinol methylase